MDDMNLIELVDEYSRTGNSKYISKILFYKEDEGNRMLSIQDLISHTIENTLNLKLLPCNWKPELINQAEKRIMDVLERNFEVNKDTDKSSILSYIKEHTRGAVKDFNREHKDAQKINYEWFFPSHHSTYVSTNEAFNNFSSLDNLIRCKSPEDIVVRNESRNELYEDLGQAINQLTNKQRKVIKGIYFQEKTQTQLAKEINISQQGINQRKSRAINSLKRKIEN